MRGLIIILLVATLFLSVSNNAAGQTNVTAIEYFFDTDPGFGSGTAVAVVTPAPDVQNMVIPVSLSALSTGMHTLYVRTKDANNNWSLTNNSKVYKEAAYPTSLTAGNITAIEYFFDTDPGFGSGTSVPVTTPATDIQNMAFAANISTLSTGMHTFYVRTKDADNKWSLTNLAKFYKEAFYPSPTVSGPFRRIEYFIDTDPGFGNATPVIIAANQTEIQNLSFTVPLNGIQSGNHFLYVRSLDDDWGLTNVVQFATNSVLPITLLDFRALKNVGQTLLAWETASEYNNNYFEIEKSVDGVTMSTLLRVVSKGNSNTMQSYTAIDILPFAGANYYRLKQIDNDGKFSYSPIRLVNYSAGLGQVLNIYPNPARDIVKVDFPQSLYNKQAVINIIDASGKMVKQWTVNSVQPNSLQLFVSELPRSVYFVQVVTNGEVLTSKMTKE